LSVWEIEITLRRKGDASGHGEPRHGFRAGLQLPGAGYELSKETSSNGSREGDNLYLGPTVRVNPASSWSSTTATAYRIWWSKMP